MSETSHLGQWIKRRRRELDLNQEQLAECASCSVSLLQKIETGQRRPSRTLAYYLARVLELAPTEAEQFVHLARQPPDSAGTRPGIAPEEMPLPADNVPPVLSPLVGRAAEIEALQAALHNPNIRLVTLSGPGGVGKTRLATHLAHALRESFPAGVVWVALAPLREASAVLPTIARAVGAPAPANQDTQEALLAFLRPHALLLVLDNFEHVPQAAPLLPVLLAACPQIKLLITSRAVLHIRGEYEYPLSPLAVPDSGPLPVQANLKHYAALDLLLQRLQAIRPGFALTPENASDLAEICVRLDGLPLALELAAIRLKLLSPSALLQRLDQRFALLKGGYRDLYPHQQSLETLFAWSYDLLAPAEQTLFRQLAVFAGGATFEALEAICHIPLSALFESLQALVDNSLLAQRTHSDEPRLVMLETVREFALAQLAAQEEDTDLFQRHAHYYADLAQQAPPEQLGAEQANLQAALHWAVQQGDAALALQLGSAIWRIWQQPRHTPAPAATSGLRVPVPAPTPFAAATTFHSLPLIGREGELAYLLRQVQPILAGQNGGVLTIYGAAGMGKSRLVQELRRLLMQEYHLRWLSCAPNSDYTPSLGPLRALMRDYFLQDTTQSATTNHERFTYLLNTLQTMMQDAASENDTRTPARVAADLERLRPFLAALAGVEWADTTGTAAGLEPAARFEQMLLAVATWLHAESLRQPLVLHIDDMHWLDADTHTALPMLARHLRSAPVAILLTSRDGANAAQPIDMAPLVQHATLTLQPLSSAALRTYAAHLMGGDVSGELLHLLTTQSGGNPFFLEHLLFDLHERGLLVSEAAQSTAAHRIRLAAAHLPDAVLATDIKSVLHARLTRLSQQAQALIQTAAVLGSSFEVQLLAHMLRSEALGIVPGEKNQEAWIWLTMQQLHGLFRHPLLQEVAYEAGTHTQNQQLHALAAAAIEHVHAQHLEHYLDALAYHYGQAGNAEQERAYAWAAGEQAAARYANADAMRHFSRVLALIPEADHAERFRLLLAREQVYAHTGDMAARQADLSALQTLAEQMRDAQGLLTARLRAAACAEETSDFVRAAQLADEAIALARAIGNRQGETEALMLRGIVYRLAQEPGQATVLLQQAHTLAEQTGLPRVALRCLRNLANIAGEKGDYATELAVAQQALATSRAIGNKKSEALVLGNLGISSREQEHYLEARTYFEQAMALYRDIGYRRGMALMLDQLAVVQMVLGEYEQAQQYHREALRLLRDIGYREGEGIVCSNLSYLSFEQGNYLLAREYGEQACQIGRSIQATDTELAGLTNLGWALLAVEDLEAAHTCFGQSIALCHTLDNFYDLPEAQAGMALAEQCQGHAALAREQVETILSLLTSEAPPIVNEPMRIWAACAYVLQVHQDARYKEARKRAIDLLNQNLALIHDPAARARVQASTTATMVQSLQTSGVAAGSISRLFGTSRTHSSWPVNHLVG